MVLTDFHSTRMDSRLARGEIGVHRNEGARGGPQTGGGGQGTPPPPLLPPSWQVVLMYEFGFCFARRTIFQFGGLFFLSVTAFIGLLHWRRPISASLLAPGAPGARGAPASRGNQRQEDRHLHRDQGHPLLQAGGQAGGSVAAALLGAAGADHDHDAAARCAAGIAHEAVAPAQLAQEPGD